MRLIRLFPRLGSIHVEKGLKELKEHGIDYVMMSGPCRLSEIVKDEELAQEAWDFIEFAYNTFRIRSVIFAGSRVSDGLFVDQDFVKAQSDTIARGMKKLKGVKRLYALYIEDEPYLGWDVRPSSVRDKYNDLFEKEMGHRLPEKGRVMGRWDFETAMAYCHWISQKYLDYIKKIIEKYKKVSPNLKSALNLRIGGVFPSLGYLHCSYRHSGDIVDIHIPHLIERASPSLSHVVAVSHIQQAGL